MTNRSDILGIPYPKFKIGDRVRYDDPKHPVTGTIVGCVGDFDIKEWYYFVWFDGFELSEEPFFDAESILEVIP